MVVAVRVRASVFRAWIYVQVGYMKYSKLIAVFDIAYQQQRDVFGDTAYSLRSDRVQREIAHRRTRHPQPIPILL